MPKYEAELEEIKKDLEKVKTERRAAVVALIADKVRSEQATKSDQLQENVAVWKREEAKLQQEVDRLGLEAQKIGITSFELELKRTEIDQAETVLKRLRDEKERLQVELQSTSQRVTVLSAAEVPELPDGATRIRGTALAGFAGLLAGFFGVSYWDARGRRIRTKEEVANELGLRVVGTLPALPGKPGLEPARPRAAGRGADPAAVWLASIDSIRAAVLCDADDRPGCAGLAGDQRAGPRREDDAGLPPGLEPGAGRQAGAAGRLRQPAAAAARRAEHPGDAGPERGSGR